MKSPKIYLKGVFVKMKGGIGLRRKKKKKYYEISSIYECVEKLLMIIDCNI